MFHCPLPQGSVGLAEKKMDVELIEERIGNNQRSFCVATPGPICDTKGRC